MEFTTSQVEFLNRFHENLKRQPNYEQIKDKAYSEQLIQWVRDNK